MVTGKPQYTTFWKSRVHIEYNNHWAKTILRFLSLV
jgi:hypothetical protein